MHKRTVPVLVIGAGPVGLSTGLFLAHWGVPALVAEKRPAISDIPRASSSLRTLELFRLIGLGEAVERVGWRGGPPMRTVFKDTALGATLHRGGLPPRYERFLRECSPIDPRLIITHDQVQRLALTESRRKGAEVRFGLELLGLEHDADGVRALLVDRGTGAHWQITADYVIGADGANSTVRQALGITMPDREPIAPLHTVFFRADLGSALRDWGTHMCFVRNDAVYATVMSKNGRDQWSSHIMDYPGKPEGAVPLTKAEAAELVRAALGDDTIPLEVHAVNGWEAAVGMASSFRQGRIFLAGDAAHVQSSAGGLGMNTGIQDGHNLAWKIGAVRGGPFAPALLDTYEPERRSAATASLALSRGVHHGYRRLDGDPNALYDRIAADYLRAMLCYGYTTAPAPDVLDPTIRPGYRFPHRWVIDKISTLDLIGSRWTLLTGDDPEKWRTATEPLGLPLPVGHLDGLDQTVLVRPDGFVAWVGSDEDSLRAALAPLLK
ncbi:FAD-binding monooxygenase [Nocardia terpenica]|uniref:FAD-dependent monooxygenase n=1 Tax=Nocardia terpenica TaxID=455432 RepID=UPI002FDFE3C3